MSASTHFERFCYVHALLTLALHQPLTPSQIADLRLAASKMTGAKRCRLVKKPKHMFSQAFTDLPSLLNVLISSSL